MKTVFSFIKAYILVKEAKMLERKLTLPVVGKVPIIIKMIIEKNNSRFIEFLQCIRAYFANQAFFYFEDLTCKSFSLCTLFLNYILKKILSNR